MKTYRCAKSYESLEKLILDKKIEAVLVVTPGPDHVRHCKAVLGAGKHVKSAVPAAWGSLAGILSCAGSGIPGPNSE